MFEGEMSSDKERRCEEEGEMKTVDQLEKDLDEYIRLYNQEYILREDAQRKLINLKKTYVRESAPLTKTAVGYITNVISTARTAMGWGTALSFIAFIFMISAGARAEAQGLEPLSAMYPIGAFLSGIIGLLITVFMPDEGTTYHLIDEYRKSQIADRLYDAGLLDDDEYEDD